MISSELFGTFHRLAWEGLHAIADEKYQLSSTTFPLRHFCLQVFPRVGAPAERLWSPKYINDAGAAAPRGRGGASA